MSKTLDDITLKILACWTIMGMLSKHLLNRTSLTDEGTTQLYFAAFAKILLEVQEEKMKEIGSSSLNEEQRKQINDYIKSTVTTIVEESEALVNADPELFEEFQKHFKNGNFPDEFLKRTRNKFDN